MALVETSVSAEEVAAKALDYPMFVGNNILERSSIPPQWRVAGSWSAGADTTVNAAPTRLAYDRNGLTQTRCSVVGQTQVSLLFDLSASALEVGSFDTVFVIGHNYHLLGGLDSVQLEIGDDPTFTGHWPLALWTSFTSSQRQVSVSLNNSVGVPNSRFHSVRYLRLRHTCAAGFAASPAIGELVVGRRRQMTSMPMLPFKRNPLRSEVADFRSESGNMTRHTLYAGAGDRPVSFEFGGISAGALDPRSEMQKFFKNTNYGSKAFIYVASPNSDSRAARMMLLDPPSQEIADQGPYDAIVDLPMLECEPFLDSEIPEV